MFRRMESTIIKSMPNHRSVPGCPGGKMEVHHCTNIESLAVGHQMLFVRRPTSSVVVRYDAIVVSACHRILRQYLRTCSHTHTNRMHPVWQMHWPVESICVRLVRISTHIRSKTWCGVVLCRCRPNAAQMFALFACINNRRTRPGFGFVSTVLCLGVCEPEYLCHRVGLLPPEKSRRRDDLGLYLYLTLYAVVAYNGMGRGVVTVVVVFVVNSIHRVCVARRHDNNSCDLMVWGASGLACERIILDAQHGTTGWTHAGGFWESGLGVYSVLDKWSYIRNQ